MMEQIGLQDLVWEQLEELHSRIWNIQNRLLAAGGNTWLNTGQKNLQEKHQLLI